MRSPVSWWRAGRRARRERRALGQGLVGSERLSPGFVRFDLDLSPFVQATERMEVDVIAPERLAFSGARLSAIDWNGTITGVSGADIARSSNRVEAAFDPGEEPMRGYRLVAELVPTTTGIMRAAFFTAFLALATVTFFGWLVVVEGCALDREIRPQQGCDYDFPGRSDAAVTVVLVAAGLAGAAFSERSTDPLEARAQARIRFWLYVSFTATLVAAAIVAGDVRHDPSRFGWIYAFVTCFVSASILGISGVRIRRRLRTHR